MVASSNSPVEIINDEGKSILKLREGVDLSIIEEVLRSARQTVDRGLPIFLDVGELAFLDTSIVQLLISLRETCRSKGIPFSSHSPDAMVMNVLRVAGFSDLFPEPATLAAI